MPRSVATCPACGGADYVPHDLANCARALRAAYDLLLREHHTFRRAVDRLRTLLLSLAVYGKEPPGGPHDYEQLVQWVRETATAALAVFDAKVGTGTAPYGATSRRRRMP